MQKIIIFGTRLVLGLLTSSLIFQEVIPQLIQKLEKLSPLQQKEINISLVL